MVSQGGWMQGLSCKGLSLAPSLGCALGPCCGPEGGQGRWRGPVFLLEAVVWGQG